MIASMVLVDRIILVFVSILFEKSTSRFKHCSLLAEQCSDGLKDVNETDIDCGGDCVVKDKRCGLTMDCKEDNDCISKICSIGKTCIGM